MAFTYDTTTDIGMIRLLITDTDSANPFFSDEELTAFQSLETSVRSTAALALETIARNEALVQKVIKTLSLSTDGVKLSAELRQHAAELRSQDSASDGNDEPAFEIAEWVNGPFAYREYWYNRALRGL